MVDTNQVFSDNEYTIMSEIVENENITQRELSKKLGISVSTVNVLVNKMIKEGLVKMTQVSQKQVFYMLTPVGMMEKSRKTVSYLKAHYRAIYQTKEKLKALLTTLQQQDAIFILLTGDEVDEIIHIAVSEHESAYNNPRIVLLETLEELNTQDLGAPVLLHMTTDLEMLDQYTTTRNLQIINITDYL